MKIKRFFAKDMRTALNEVKQELGVDAVIMSNKKLADGVEIVAAIDNDKMVAKPAVQSKANFYQDDENEKVSFDGLAAKIAQHTKQEPNFVQTFSKARQSQQQEAVADSLEALLNRKVQHAQPKANKPKAPSTSWMADDDSAHDPYFDEPLRGDEFAGSQFTGKSTKQAQSNSAEMDALKDEMSAIRELLEYQLSGLMSQEMQRRDPTRALLLDRLKGMGISADVADQMACFIPDDVSAPKAWQSLLEMVRSQLYTSNNEIMTRGGVYALVGPTGVGKTTTIAKLAAIAAQKFGADKIALVTTDTYRIGAYEQLATYGRIIGCPVKQAKDANELTELLYHFRNKRLVLIDTAGMSQRDLRLTEQLNTLMRNTRVDIRNYLVLSATAQIEVQQEAINQFKQVSLSGCIFTKLDECLSLGEIISVAIQNRLPIGYLTNGQRVPEDIRVANAEKLLAKAEQLYVKRTNAQTKRRSGLAQPAVGMYD